MGDLLTNAEHIFDEWYQRPLEIFITIRNNRFGVCFRNQWLCQEWLLDRNIINFSQPGEFGNIIELYDINDVIDLMELMVQLGRRFEMVLSHPVYRVVITNQENGRFKAVCSTFRHAENLHRNIGVSRCGLIGRGHQQEVFDIPCLSELLSFLSLPFHVQVREPS